MKKKRNTNAIAIAVFFVVSKTGFRRISKIQGHDSIILFIKNKKKMYNLYKIHFFVYFVRRNKKKSAKLTKK